MGAGMSRPKSGYSTLILIIVLLTGAWAGVTGKLIGKVTDKDSDQPLPGINILVQVADNQGKAGDTITGAATDERGAFMIINIPPGVYFVRASAISYQDMIIEDVEVSSDHTTRVEFPLTISTLEMAAVVVVSQRKLIQQDLTSSAVSVNAAEIEIMPVNSVNEILDLQAGMVRDAGGNLHIRGGRSEEVTYLIDGVQVVDALSRKQGLTIDNQAVAELQAITGTFNAEYGQALSGVINIVTKSGSRRFEANARAIFSDFYSDSDVYAIMSNAQWVYHAAGSLTHNNYQLPEEFYEPYLAEYNQMQTDEDIIRFLEDKPMHTYINANEYFDPTDNMDYQINVSGPITPNKKMTYFASARYEDYTGFEFGKRYFMPWGQLPPSGDSLNVELVDTVWTETGFELDSLNMYKRWPEPDRKVVPLSWRERFSAQMKIYYDLIDAINVSYGLYYSDQEHISAGHSYKYNPDGTKTYYTTSQTHILAMNHMLTPETFYELKVSYFQKDHENYIYELAWEDIDRYVKDRIPLDYHYMPEQGGDAEQYIYGGNPFNDVSLASSYNDFRFWGNEVDHGYNMVNYWTFKFDYTSQVNPTNLVKFGIEQRLHEVENEWFSMQFSDRYEALIMPISSPFHLHYHHNPMEFSAFVQDKIEFQELIINLGLRYDFFEPDGRILADPSDPQIYAPFNPYHIYKNFHPELPEEELEEYTVQERGEFWWKDVDPKYQLSPRLGVSFPITDKGAIHFSYGHFFQNPAFQYLYRNPEFEIDGAGTNQYIGNADLDAERTVMYEVGIQQTVTRNVVVHATGFYRDIRDWVGMSPPIDTYSARTTYQKYINKDYAAVKGFTLTTRYDSDELAAKVDYTYMSAQGTSSDPLDAYHDEQDNNAPRIQMVFLDWDQTHTLNFFMANKRQQWSASVVTKLNSGQPFTPTFPEGEVAGGGTFKGLRENIDRRPPVYLLDIRLVKWFYAGSYRYELGLDLMNALDIRAPRNAFTDSGRPDYTSQGQSQELRFFEISNVDEYFRRPGNYYAPRRIQLALSIGM